MLTLIAAMTENRVIARDGEMPWHLPADLRHFKSRTMSHSVIMGRRTWEALNGPLPGRTNIIITRQSDFTADGAIVVHDLDDAIDQACSATETDDDEIFIAGGGEIYAFALPRADRLDLTIIHTTVEGDTFFPDFNESNWALVQEERHEADARHAHAYSFRTYERAT